MSSSRQSSVSSKRGSSSYSRGNSQSSHYCYSSTSSGRFTTSSVCNLIMPVSRIKTMLKVYNYANRVCDTSAVFLTSTLEYIVTEILEMSLNAALSRGSKRIQAKHVNMAIKTDPEFFMNFRNTSVVEGGIAPLEHEKFLALTKNLPLKVIMEDPIKEVLKNKSRSHSSGSRRKRNRC